MKLPFLKPQRDPATLTDAEIDSEIARHDALLDRRKEMTAAIASAAILISAAAIVTLFFATGGLMTPLVTWGGIGIGVAASGGISGVCKGVVNHAMRARNNLVDVYNDRVIAQQQAAEAARAEAARQAEADRLRGIQAADDFNTAVNSGLPLEQDITVKKSLKLKFPKSPARHGFARILDVFDPRL